MRNMRDLSPWLNRVEEVVNYALAADMYVVMNEHWDGGWLNDPVYGRQDELNDRLATMWEQIATHFRDYDHRLIFAGTNEVVPAYWDNCWAGDHGFALFDRADGHQIDADLIEAVVGAGG